jgi:hypothetical protein
VIGRGMGGVLVDFKSEISRLYADHGPRHLVPYIGEAFARPSPEDFRVAVVGFNCYISQCDEPKDVNQMRPWFSGWWEQAGIKDGSYRFYNDALREIGELASFVARQPQWKGLRCQLTAESKKSLYATNTIKIYADESLKKSSAISAEMMESHSQTWRDEMRLMANHGCLPHLIIVFGRAIWEPHWRSLHPDSASAVALGVTSYVTIPDTQAPAFHHVNRIVLGQDGAAHTLLLTCLHHPSARVRRNARKNAAWLIGQKAFQDLARVNDAPR